jgi:hypothetical protein
MPTVTVAQLKLGYEEVFTVTDYYDGPRRGIANFNGKPHLYDCIFDEVRDDYSDEYQLTAIPNHIFDLAMEDWAIWERWRTAFDAGQATNESHPALPQDRTRHDEIRSVLNSALKTDELRSVVRIGLFEPIRTPALLRGAMVDMQVKWTDERA